MRNADSDTDPNGNCNCNCDGHSNADQYTIRNSTYANTTDSTNTSTPTVTTIVRDAIWNWREDLASSLAALNWMFYSTGIFPA